MIKIEHLDYQLLDFSKQTTCFNLFFVNLQRITTYLQISMMSCKKYLSLYFLLLLSLVSLGAIVFSSCSEEDEISHTAEKGLVQFEYNEVVIDENITLPQTRAVSTPATSDFTLWIAKTDGTTIYEGKPLTEDLVLSTGSYSGKLSYGSNYLSGEQIHASSPYYHQEKEFDVKTGEKTTISFTPKLSGAVLLVNIEQALLAHYQQYEIKLEGTANGSAFSTTMTAGAQLFIRPGIAVSITFVATNTLGEQSNTTIFSSSTLTNGVLADVTEYVVNLKDNSPIFSIPAQNDLSVWSYSAQFTPLTESNFSQGNANAVLPKVTYELVRATDNAVIQGTVANNQVTFSNLTPSTTYTYRAKYKAVNSSNTFTFTTESAEQLVNGNLDTWSTGTIKGTLSSQDIYYPNSTAANTHWATRNTQTMSSGAGYWYTHCPGTRQATGRSGNDSDKAASITTVGWGSGNTWASFMSTAKINNISSGWLVYGDVNSSGNITKNRTIGARPDKLSFWYKYTAKAENTWNATVEVLSDGDVIGSASHTSTTASVTSYTQMTLDIAYTDLTKKATHIYVYFTNRTDDAYSKDHIEKKSSPNR